MIAQANIVALLICCFEPSMDQGLRLDIENKSWWFTEFRIRPSGSGGEWTKVRLSQGEADRIDVASGYSFDVQIWRYIGENRWIVDCRRRISLQAWPKDSRKYRETYREPFRRWVVKAASDGTVDEDTYEDLGDRTLMFFADGDRFIWPVESTIFRLVE